MDYGKDILNRLLDMYERRGAFDKDASSLRAIRIDIGKVYPEYVNRYNHDAYKYINDTIDKLCMEELTFAEKNSVGKYSKVRLNVANVSQCYKKMKRISIKDQCENVKKSLIRYQNCENPLLQALIRDWLKYMAEYKKLPHDLKYDSRKVSEILYVLQAILELNTETYIRNFSTALFKDSKRFQKEFMGPISSILFEYTDEVVEKDSILSFYNLYENPTYVLVKGDAVIKFDSSVIDVSELPDGIALSNASLEKIRTVAVKAGRVITVENLTTYHDSDEDDAVHIYLGGYHNRSKQLLLEKIYADNKAINYYHKGDLDVYGFLILENLKEKTDIPFEPLMMDVATIERFYKAGLYKELTATDVKVINEKKSTKLVAYAEVLQFMLDKNCKVEQESIKAVELMK